MSYTVLRGIPVRNYRAEVTLTPTATGTHIEWVAQWNGLSWSAWWRPRNVARPLSGSDRLSQTQSGLSVEQLAGDLEVTGVCSCLLDEMEDDLAHALRLLEVLGAMPAPRC
jgi:hypothetical protein